MRLDGDSHFQVSPRTLARSRSGSDQGGTPQTGPDPRLCGLCAWSHVYDDPFLLARLF